MKKKTPRSSAQRVRKFYANMSEQEQKAYNKCRNDKARAKRHRQEPSTVALSPPGSLVHEANPLPEEQQRAAKRRKHEPSTSMPLPSGSLVREVNPLPEEQRRASKRCKQEPSTAVPSPSYSVVHEANPLQEEQQRAAKTHEEQPITSVLSPADNLVHEVNSLREEQRRITTAFNLNEADCFSPSQSKACQIQCQNLMEKGSLDGYRQFKDLKKSTKPVLFLIDSLLERYSKAEKHARPDFPTILVTILEGQGTLRAIRDGLLSNYNLVMTTFDTWCRSAVQVISKIVDEHIGNLPNNWKCSYLTLHDVQRLKQSCWLNDTLMDYLLENSPLLDPLTTLCLSPFFYTKYMRFATNEASKAQWKGAWSWKNSQILNCIGTVEKILIPVNLNNKHWVLLYADLPNQCICVLDSLNRTCKKDLKWENSIHGHLIKSMLLLLSKIHERFGKESIKEAKKFHLQPNYKVKPVSNYALSKWLNLGISQVPLQGNDNDCGIYTLMFARHLLTGPGINHAGVPPGQLIYSESLNTMFMRLNFLEEIAPI